MISTITEVFDGNNDVFDDLYDDERTRTTQKIDDFVRPMFTTDVKGRVDVHIPLGGENNGTTWAATVQVEGNKGSVSASGSYNTANGQGSIDLSAQGNTNNNKGNSGKGG